MTGLHELGLAAAARAIRNGEVSSETYVGTLLKIAVSDRRTLGGLSQCLR